ncbi:hypothetical protein HYD_6170 [Candidatus Hydrogenosomobacter endosymbioticus]|uniref:Uncharacterized protein n=1 Tax=Candidatus Hydrogenosomobacter endosymbioticus TaxID=2558174 RepID=A0ABN6L3H0_9PROT|nr:hypothetical protein HYD_6170 [Candidatus Hydrogenosomobacter endosymbioticus]
MKTGVEHSNIIPEFGLAVNAIQVANAKNIKCKNLYARHCVELVEKSLIFEQYRRSAASHKYIEHETTVT